MRAGVYFASVTLVEVATNRLKSLVIQLQVTIERL